MSRIFSSKKRFVLGVLASLAIATAAFAYWTTGGTGEGTATTGDDTGVTITGTTPALDELTPGGPAVTVSFTAANLATFNQSIDTIKLVDVDAYEDADHEIPIPAADCGGANDTSAIPTSDFSMQDVDVDPAADADGDISPGATAESLTSPGSIKMNNLDENQNDCKNAYLVLNFTVVE